MKDARGDQNARTWSIDSIFFQRTDEDQISYIHHLTPEKDYTPWNNSFNWSGFLIPAKNTMTPVQAALSKYTFSNAASGARALSIVCNHLNRGTHDRAITYLVVWAWVMHIIKNCLSFAAYRGDIVILPPCILTLAVTHSGECARVELILAIGW